MTPVWLPKDNCIVTKNYSLLEPGQFARKYYARGVGTILEVENTGEVVQLVKCNFDSVRRSAVALRSL